MTARFLVYFNARTRDNYAMRARMQPLSDVERGLLRAALEKLVITQEAFGRTLHRLFPHRRGFGRSFISLILRGIQGKENPNLGRQFRDGFLELLREQLAERRIAQEDVKELIKSLSGQVSAQTQGEAADVPLLMVLSEFYESLPPETKGPVPHPKVGSDLANHSRSGTERSCEWLLDAPKRPFLPVGALPDDALNRVATAALSAAVRHATSFPRFNLHVSGPRFNGTTTVLRAVEAAVKRKNPDALVCFFDCARTADPFGPKFKQRMRGESSVKDAVADNGKDRIGETLAQLWGELLIELEMPRPEDSMDMKLGEGHGVGRDFIQALKRSIRLLEGKSLRPRLLILDGLDPTDEPLARALCEVAAGVNELRAEPHGISIAGGTRYRKELLLRLDSIRSASSSTVGEKFQQVETDGFSVAEAYKLAELLADGNSALESRMKAECEKRDLPGRHPLLLHAALWHLRNFKDANVDANALHSLFDDMEAGVISADEVPTGIRMFAAHLGRVNDMLHACNVGKLDGIPQGKPGYEQQRFVDTFMISAGWHDEANGKRNYRWGSFEHAWESANV